MWTHCPAEGAEGPAGRRGAAPGMHVYYVDRLLAYMSELTSGERCRKWVVSGYRSNRLADLCKQSASQRSRDRHGAGDPPARPRDRQGTEGAERPAGRPPARGADRPPRAPRDRQGAEGPAGTVAGCLLTCLS